MNEHSGGELSLYLRIVLPVIGLTDVDLGEQKVKKQHLRQILPTCCIRPYKLLRNTSLYLFICLYLYLFIFRYNLQCRNKAAPHELT